MRLDNNLGAFLLPRKGDEMFIWNLVSITAGVIVLIVLLIFGYAVVDVLIRGIKESIAKSRR